MQRTYESHMKKNIRQRIGKYLLDFKKFLKFGVDFLKQIPYTMGVGSPNKLELSWA